MGPPLNRVKREQLRKRRNNLLRRHNEFWLLYGMKSWLIMELPDGQIFTYHSHPDTPPPSSEDMVRQDWYEYSVICRWLVKEHTAQAHYCSNALRFQSCDLCSVSWQRHPVPLCSNPSNPEMGGSGELLREESSHGLIVIQTVLCLVSPLRCTVGSVRHFKKFRSQLSG